MKLTKGPTFILWVILAVSFYLIVSLFNNLDANGSDPHMLKWISANLSWSYILLGIATVAAIVMEFLNILSDKKAARKFMIGIGLLGAVFLISYLMSDKEMPQFSKADQFVENGTSTPSVLGWIGTSLIASYLLFGIAVLAIIWSAISNIFK